MLATQVANPRAAVLASEKAHRNALYGGYHSFRMACALAYGPCFGIWPVFGQQHVYLHVPICI